MCIGGCGWGDAPLVPQMHKGASLIRKYWGSPLESGSARWWFHLWLVRVLRRYQPSKLCAANRRHSWAGNWLMDPNGLVGLARGHIGPFGPGPSIAHLCMCYCYIKATEWSIHRDVYMCIFLGERDSFYIVILGTGYKGVRNQRYAQKHWIRDFLVPVE